MIVEHEKDDQEDQIPSNNFDHLPKQNEWIMQPHNLEKRYQKLQQWAIDKQTPKKTEDDFEMEKRMARAVQKVKEYQNPDAQIGDDLIDP